MKKKLLRWQLVNHPDKCPGDPDAAARSQAMNERFALFAKAVEEDITRRDDEVIERRLEKKNLQKAAAAAAEALSRSLLAVQG